MPDSIADNPPLSSLESSRPTHYDIAPSGGNIGRVIMPYVLILSDGEIVGYRGFRKNQKLDMALWAQDAERSTGKMTQIVSIEYVAKLERLGKLPPNRPDIPLDTIGFSW